MANHFNYDTNQNISDLKLDLTEIAKSALNLVKHLENDASISRVTIAGYINDPSLVEIIRQALSEGLKDTMFSLSLASDGIECNVIGCEGIGCDEFEYRADILEEACLTCHDILDDDDKDEKIIYYLPNGLKNTRKNKSDGCNVIGCDGIGCDGIEHRADILEDACLTCYDILDDDDDTKEKIIYLTNGLKNTRIISLELKYSLIRCEGIKYLADIFKGTCLTTLNINFNQIGDKEMQYLAGGLKNTRILSLNVSFNNIGSLGSKYLADIFKGTCLTTLDIYHNLIGDEGMHYLASGLKNTSIISLNVSYNYIGNIGIKYLADVLKDTCITLLDISNNLIGDEGMQYLAGGLKNTSILSLNVSQNNIGSIGSKYLADILKDTCITSLDICNNINIGDEGTQYLAGGLKNTGIISLNVSYNKIRSTGIQYLADILKDTCITSLNISHNDIGDEGIQYLASRLKNTSILSLDVTKNNIGNIDRKYLANILKDTCITSLDISYNYKIGDEGMQYLASGFKDTCITSLDISNNNIDEVMQYVVKHLEDTCITSLKTDHRINVKNQAISKNKILARKIQDSFQNLVAQNTQNDDLEFIIPIIIPINMEQYLYIIKVLKDTPNVKAHIIDMVCAIGVSKFPNIIQKINEFVSNVSDKFIAFIENNLLYLQNVLGDDYNYVDLVRQCDDMQCAGDIVQYLLLHRQLYYVDDDQEILHPYIYKMLHKHDMPLFNEQINPNKRDEIISHFQNYPEIDDTREIIDILLKMNITQHS